MSELRRVALTGAGGFIGSAVCRALTSLGCEIRALVGLPDEPLKTPPGVSLAMRADITDGAALDALLDGGVDAVLHLAGPPSVRASFAAPLAHVQAHTGGTAALLEACRRSGAAPAFVYVSSAEVYGRPRANPVAESHPLDARSPYAAAKIGAEQLVRAYNHAYGTAATIVRPFSVFGPGMGAHALIPTIVAQLGAAGPLRLADLRPERDYVHVDDVARAVISAARRRGTETAAVNVGSGIGTSVGALARAALRLTGRDRAIEADPAARRPGNSDILCLVADRSEARRVLDWEPRVSLDTGLRELLLGRTSGTSCAT